MLRSPGDERSVENELMFQLGLGFDLIKELVRNRCVEEGKQIAEWEQSTISVRSLNSRRDGEVLPAFLPNITLVRRCTTLYCVVLSIRG